MKTLFFVAWALVSVFSGASQSQATTGQRLIDSNDRPVKVADYRGKVIVLDFWFTGCINCAKFFQGELSAAERHFAQDSNVVFISICIDKNKATWLNSLQKGKYSSTESVNLYTAGLGDQHPVIKEFGVVSYPQPIVLDRRGAIISRSGNLTQPNRLIGAIEAGLKN